MRGVKQRLPFGWKEGEIPANRMKTLGGLSLYGHIRSTQASKLNRFMVDLIPQHARGQQLERAERREGRNRQTRVRAGCLKPQKQPFISIAPRINRLPIDQSRLSRTKRDTSPAHIRRPMCGRLYLNFYSKLALRDVAKHHRISRAYAESDDLNILVSHVLYQTRPKITYSLPCTIRITDRHQHCAIQVEVIRFRRDRLQTEIWRWHSPSRTLRRTGKFLLKIIEQIGLSASGGPKQRDDSAFLMSRQINSAEHFIEAFVICVMPDPDIQNAWIKRAGHFLFLRSISGNDSGRLRTVRDPLEISLTARSISSSAGGAVFEFSIISASRMR